MPIIESELNLIQIYGLECKTTIGVLEWEKKQQQILLVDLDIEIPFTESAFIEDQLSGTINYTEIAEDLRTWLSNHRCELLECLAEQMAQRILNRYSAIAVRIALTKPAILAGSNRVTVRIDRIKK